MFGANTMVAIFRGLHGGEATHLEEGIGTAQLLIFQMVQMLGNGVLRVAKKIVWDPCVGLYMNITSFVKKVSE